MTESNFLSVSVSLWQYLLKPSSFKWRATIFHDWKFLWSEHLDICVCALNTRLNSKMTKRMRFCGGNTIRHKHKLCKNFEFTSNCSHWNVICPRLKRQSISKKGMKRAIIIVHLSPFVHFLLELPLWANFCCCWLAHTNLHSNPSLDNSCTRSNITC